MKNFSTSSLLEVCQRLEEYYISASGLNSLFTLPEIFGKQYNELFASAWLAFLLDPSRNGFGVAPLMAMLNILSEEYYIEENEDILIEKERTFEDGRRIDILITTEKYLIGIEMKIYAGEQEDQTKDYWKSIQGESLKKGRKPICIFLAPMKPQDNNFRKISYGQLCEAFKKIPYEILRDSRKNSLFYEFILYMEEKLMDTTENGFPIKSDVVQIYLEHAETIRGAEALYDKYMANFGAWLHEITKEETGGWIIDEPQSNFWIIRQREDWKGPDYDFHFELMWNKTNKRIAELTEHDYVTLVVHLEGNRRVKDMFGIKARPKEKVLVNFQSEPGSRESIKMITEKLRSGDFQKIAKLFNDFLDTNK